MSVTTRIYRHELPRGAYRFTIQGHGLKPLCLRVEDDVPVIYEIGVTSPEDHEPFPRHFIWIQTGSQLPESATANTYVGTVQFSDGHVEHLFQEWRQ